jgi:hypothetical protein
MAIMTMENDKILKNLSGKGEVWDGSNKIATVKYHLTMGKVGPSPGGNGLLERTDGGIFTIEHGRLTLHLENVWKIDFNITRTKGFGKCQIELTGPFYQ